MDNNKNFSDIHRDVDFANRYRIEYIKHLMSLSAGIFVISIAFMKEIIGNYSDAHFKIGLIAGWGCLIISLIGGIFHMKSWDRFYISYRKSKEIGSIRRKKINLYRIIFELLQILGFIVGIVLIFLFSAINLYK